MLCIISNLLVLGFCSLCMQLYATNMCLCLIACMSRMAFLNSNDPIKWDSYCSRSSGLEEFEGQPQPPVQESYMKIAHPDSRATSGICVKRTYRAFSEAWGEFWRLRGHEHHNLLARHSLPLSASRARCTVVHTTSSCDQSGDALFLN